MAPLFPLGQQSISLLWLLQVAALLVAVSLLARGIKWFLKDRLLPRFQVPEGRREATATLTSLGVAALGYVLVVQGMGLDFGALAVILGALGVGLGFGLQDLTRNLSSGLTLLMEGKLKVGDLIEFNQTTGFIKQISIRSTVISTFQGSDIIVPNTFLTNSPVQNLSYASFTGRIDVPVMVAHGSDVFDVTEVLLQAALDEPHVNPEPAPQVLFSSQGELGLGFTLRVWTSKIDSGQTISSGLHYAIHQGLRERTIDLAWPRREIRTPGARPESLPAAPEAPGDDRRPQPPAETLSELLTNLRFFQGLHGRPLRQLLASGARRHLAAGEILVRQGESSHSFNIVLSGCVDAIHETDRVSRRLFSFQSGEFFGELPLLLEVPYPTTMQAAEDTTLFVVPRGGFRPLLQLHPAFAETIAEELNRRKDVLQSYEADLRERGLFIDASMGSPLEWIRERLRQFLRQ
ncbi:mechanosensitive ion channel [Synechococcus sp. J7-Johnson]|uniref:mechanosensitive ion channel domain-containing protein n=1 Tax=Synechococcus sp. J7-Johnson TaxID=2823737 RepID=UPI0020CEBF94|nr:mechanosensitive ion channel domain-containing protein [Synechococcus sp. J7-Johnson]MCP9842048.1 mechanosensitive ion channel [Synechococcus sp. J7-Johnson]